MCKLAHVGENLLSRPLGGSVLRLLGWHEPNALIVVVFGLILAVSLGVIAAWEVVLVHLELFSHEGLLPLLLNDALLGESPHLLDCSLGDVELIEAKLLLSEVLLLILLKVFLILVLIGLEL